MPPSPAREMLLDALREFPHAAPIVPRRRRNAGSESGAPSGRRMSWLELIYLALIALLCAAGAGLSFAAAFRGEKWFGGALVALGIAGVLVIAIGLVLAANGRKSPR
jgi:hypothetical protein